MPYTENAFLTVKTTAGAALPVSDAVVRIRGADEENRFIEYSLLTDVDGVTPPISLPTPPKVASLSPRAPESPYSSYEVEIVKSGYYTKRLVGLAMFSGIDTILPIDMIPLGEGELGGVLNLTLTQNEMLE